MRCEYEKYRPQWASLWYARTWSEGSFVSCGALNPSAGRGVGCSYKVPGRWWDFVEVECCVDRFPRHTREHSSNVECDQGEIAARMDDNCASCRNVDLKDRADRRAAREEPLLCWAELRCCGAHQTAARERGECSDVCAFEAE